jgi:hypothetical protein
LYSGLHKCRHSATWATSPAHSALVVLEKGFCFLPRLVWMSGLLLTSCCSWDDRQVPPHPGFSCWDGVSWSFLS